MTCHLTIVPDNMQIPEFLRGEINPVAVQAAKADMLSVETKKAIIVAAILNTTLSPARWSPSPRTTTPAKLIALVLIALLGVFWGAINV